MGKIGKGTGSFGKRHNKSHTLCRRYVKTRPISFTAASPFLQRRDLRPIPELDWPSHPRCPNRCGRRAYHIQKSTCGACGYPSARKRNCEYPAGSLLPPRNGPQWPRVGDDAPDDAGPYADATSLSPLSLRQLVREGDRPPHHRYRPHEVPQAPPPPLQERLPWGWVRASHLSRVPSMKKSTSDRRRQPRAVRGRGRGYPASHGRERRSLREGTPDRSSRRAMARARLVTGPRRRARIAPDIDDLHL